LVDVREADRSRIPPRGPWASAVDEIASFASTVLPLQRWTGPVEEQHGIELGDIDKAVEAAVAVVKANADQGKR
jgi:hypothetical protein